MANPYYLDTRVFSTATVSKPFHTMILISPTKTKKPFESRLLDKKIRTTVSILIVSK